MTSSSLLGLELVPDGPPPPGSLTRTAAPLKVLTGARRPPDLGGRSVHGVRPAAQQFPQAQLDCLRARQPAKPRPCSPPCLRFASRARCRSCRPCREAERASFIEAVASVVDGGWTYSVLTLPGLVRSLSVEARWGALRAARPRFLRRLRSRVAAPYVWTAEPHADQTPHLNLLLGARLPLRWADRAWRTSGGGSVGTPRPVYCARGIAGYVSKDFASGPVFGGRRYGAGRGVSLGIRRGPQDEP